MKDLLKRTTIAALAGVLAAGMFTGCGEKKVDGTKTVATVDGTDVPMGVLSLFARESSRHRQLLCISSLWVAVLPISGVVWQMRIQERLMERAL